MASLKDLQPVKGKWALNKNIYRELYHHVLQYKEWKRELEALSDSVKSPSMTGMPHGTGSSDPTQRLAIKRSLISKEIENVEAVAYQVGFRYAFEGYLLKWVTTEGMSYDILEARYGVLPVSRHKAHELRREFYFKYNELQSNQTLNHLF